MSYIVNGYKHPRFKIYSSRDVLVDTIDLPIVNKSGLIESAEELKIFHELLSYTYVQQVQGYRITFTLPYDEFMRGENALKVQQLIRYQKSGAKIFLMPRIDVPQRYFRVIYTGDTLETGIHGGGINSAGMKHIVLKWTTKDLVEDLNWIDPSNVVYPIWSEEWVFLPETA